MGKSVYLIAFVATLAIFSVAFFSVKAFEDARFYQVNEELNQIAFESQLDKVYSELSASDSNYYCYFIEDNIANISDTLSKLELRLKSYKESMVSQEYTVAKKNYLINNLLLYSRVKKAVADCNLDIKPILYFYAEDNSCDVECGAIANQLDQIKQLCPGAGVFAFPYNWPDYKFTSILEKQYNITKAGTIVINDKKFDSLQTNETLLNELRCK
ncbi:MAG: hypothetical protein WC308_00150 [archaeon]|jgi:hypothetical protein